MNHRFQCRCGALQGEVLRPERGVRAVCYCGDCQTYAHLLGEASLVLDPLGGTDVVATPSVFPHKVGICGMSQDDGLFVESLVAAMAQGDPAAKDRMRDFLIGRDAKVGKQ